MNCDAKGCRWVCMDMDGLEECGWVRRQRKDITRPGGTRSELNKKKQKEESR